MTEIDKRRKELFDRAFDLSNRTDAHTVGMILDVTPALRDMPLQVKAIAWLVEQLEEVTR